MPEVYSIRESLQGKLFDFIHRSGFSCVQLDEVMRDLVAALSAYREEDVALFPEVYVFGSTQAQKALSNPGGPLPILEIPIKDSAPKVLKDCAPLAIDGWAIFICKNRPNAIAYGLFRSQRHSFSTNSEEDIAMLGQENPAMLIRNSGHQTVELLNSVGERFIAIFSTSVATDRNVEEHIKHFVEAATASLREAVVFRTYARRLLNTLLQRCHGTLLAVCPLSSGARKRALADAVELNPPIDLFFLHRNAVRLNDANSLADLQAAEALVQGMIASDGVIVFRSDGVILGYRSFLKASGQESKRIPPGGGGRKRTYELMKLRIPKTFTAVLIRSQDGETACQRS